jgi:hypothetical protein
MQLESSYEAGAFIHWNALEPLFVRGAGSFAQGVEAAEESGGRMFVFKRPFFRGFSM